MSLHIYTDKKYIPSNMQCIDNNNLFFEQIPLPNNEQCKKILSIIDKATYFNENSFIPRDEKVGALSKENISTGSKTLINIITNTDKCFNVIECGSNALELLCEFNKGHIFWRYPCLFLLEDKPCDIILNDKKKFSRISKFLAYTMDRK